MSQDPTLTRDGLTLGPMKLFLDDEQVRLVPALAPTWTLIFRMGRECRCESHLVHCQE